MTGAVMQLNKCTFVHRSGAPSYTTSTYNPLILDF